MLLLSLAWHWPRMHHGSGRVQRLDDAVAMCACLCVPQNIIVGGSVVGAVGAALYSALRKEQVLCDTCQGTGGIKCFACAGEGRMENLISRDDLYRQDMARNPL